MRELYLVDLAPGQVDFPHAQQAALIVRTTHHLKKVKVTQDVQVVLFCGKSEPLSPPQAQGLLRGHWSIENSLHYVRDVTFAEDHSTAYVGHSQLNLAALRNATIAICWLNALAGGKKRAAIASDRRAAARRTNQAITKVVDPLPASQPDSP
jgi:hypothetical protein